MPVCEILYDAFENCSFLTSVNIPDSVESIGDEAFHGCSNLQEIYIPDSVFRIGVCAFDGCQNLNKLHISKSIKMIFLGAFYDCKSLSEIVIPDGILIANITASAFGNCNNLKCVYVKKGLTGMATSVLFEGNFDFKVLRTFEDVKNYLTEKMGNLKSPAQNNDLIVNVQAAISAEHLTQEMIEVTLHSVHKLENSPKKIQENIDTNKIPIDLRNRKIWQAERLKRKIDNQSN